MSLNKTIADDINRLVTPVKSGTTLTPVPAASPIGAKRGSGIFKPPVKDAAGGLVSPINMEIIGTIIRQIPVPPGATSVEVEDVYAYTLTDAQGTVYTIASVTWPTPP